MKLTGRTIAITGGNSGIGYALAKQLAASNTVIAIGRDEQRLAKAAAMVPGLRTIACDIGSADARVALADRLLREYPSLNVLFNNAGIQHHIRFGSNSGHMPEALLEEETKIDFLAPVHLCALLLPRLLEQPEAAIMNVTTGLVIVPKTESPLYCASKAALSTFTRTLRSQLMNSSVQVSEAMAPLVDTPMTHGRGRDKMQPEACAAEMIRGVEQGRPVIQVGKVKYLHLINRAWPGLANRIMARL